MARCKLPRPVWDLPALSSLELNDVIFPHNMSELFSALVSLRNLTITFPKRFLQKYFIFCSKLVNLKISTRTSTCITSTRKIMVRAPRLREICCVGIFQVRLLLVNELENANVKVLDTTEFHNLTLSRKKVFYHRLGRMFRELGSAKILNIDSATFEVLSAYTDSVEDVGSPFYNLKYVKLPKGYNVSSISTSMRKFLLGCTPGATIVTKLPQKNENYQAMHVSSTSQKVPDVPLTTPTKELVDSQGIHRKVCVDRVQVEHLGENSVVDADRVRHAGAPVARKGFDQASSSRGNSNFWLWQGLEINTEFVGLLDLIVKKFPETFEHFKAKSETFYTMKLNMLCTSVNDFLRVPMTDFCTDIITEYKDGFADLQKWGFNVYWLVDHLNYIEQIRLSRNEFHAIDLPTGDVKSKLQDLQSYCLENIKI
ncbi:uncharacterized protein LOC141668970 [Apium graveolens]|uniref:uncharacterized protein LOC141668970 n=1 Tax=Apium graveolens TaxID=4045 RepID=UPI003D7AFA25